MHTILESIWSGGVGGADLDGGEVDDDDVVADVREVPLGNTSHRKNRFLSGIAQKGGGALPEFVYPFFHHVPYILTSISCYVILFGHF